MLYFLEKNNDQVDDRPFLTPKPLSLISNFNGIYPFKITPMIPFGY